MFGRKVEGNEAWSDVSPMQQRNAFAEGLKLAMTGVEPGGHSPQLSRSGIIVGRKFVGQQLISQGVVEAKGAATMNDWIPKRVQQQGGEIVEILGKRREVGEQSDDGQMMGVAIA